MRRVIPSPAGLVILALGFALAAGSCGPVTPSPSPSSSIAGSPAVASPATPSPPTTSAPGSSSATPTSSASPAPLDRPDLAAVHVSAEVVTGGLASPLWVGAIPDGTGRLAVAEQGGRIRLVVDGRLLPAPYLDITDRVLSGGERGLLGVAFPPGFGSTRSTVYVHYSNSTGDTTIASFEVSPGDASALDPGTGRILLSEPQPYANHNGGWIGFDPGGMLLIGLGDGGSGGDPENRASRLDTILGKILRIDVLNAGSQPYAIPGDNPFVGQTGARPEILHYGLRNPFRDSIDPATGNLWIGDVGQNAWEEVDVAPAGSKGTDFGWHRWEGRHCYDPPTGCDPTGVTMPITEYGHGAGCSVIGGVVYRGDAIAALRGAYLFSDYCSGTLWAIDAGLDSAQAPITLLETGRSISSIGTDASGEVYLTDLGTGELLRLVDAP